MKKRCSKCGCFMGEKHTCKPHPSNGKIPWNKGKHPKSVQGENHPMYGKSHSEETRKKISQSLKGKISWMKGKKHTEETKIKIGLASKQRRHSEKTKERIRMAMLGTKQSQESKIKRSLAQRGNKAHNWKGGKKKTSNYIFIHILNHPHSVKSYVKQSRLIMEQYLGRYLTPEEVVHHINGITDDDRIENLILFSSQSKHISFHQKLRKLRKQT